MLVRALRRMQAAPCGCSRGRDRGHEVALPGTEAFEPDGQAGTAYPGHLWHGLSSAGQARSVPIEVQVVSSPRSAT